MEIRRGIAVSPGIAIGEVVAFGPEDLRIRRRYVAKSRIDAEIRRLDAAVTQAVAEINDEIARLGDLKVAGQVLESHRDIIGDSSLRREVAELITSKSYSAEHALSVVLRGYSLQFEKMESQYISERAHDLADIEVKMLRTLLGKKLTRATRYPKDAIIVGHNLTASQVATFDRNRVSGFAVDVGGRTAHTAIMARAMQIPAVVGLENISDEVSGGEPVIIDGYTGVVVIDPDAPTLEKYRRRASMSEQFYLRLHRQIRLPAETVDGYEILLAANIESPHEIQAALEWGACGVGLYRTEFLYDSQPPDEAKHYRTYRKAVQELRGRPLVIRTLDAGADKFHAESVGTHEPNPFLGCRSIRLCLARPELFRTQLRAVLRVSAFGPVKVMFPMVSNLEELRRAKELVAEVQEDLDRSGVKFDRDIPIGIMVEVPSVALMADQFAREVDFFSIGTNDLVQYCLAVDRVNERVAELYQPTHPAILRLIRTVIEASQVHGIALSICGEMSSEPVYAVLLLGLGLRSFSVSPISIPTVKRVIRQINMSDAAEVAQKCLRYESAEESQEFLQSRVRNLIPQF